MLNVNCPPAHFISLGFQYWHATSEIFSKEAGHVTCTISLDIAISERIGGNYVEYGPPLAASDTHIKLSSKQMDHGFMNCSLSEDLRAMDAI